MDLPSKNKDFYIKNEGGSMTKRTFDLSENNKNVSRTLGDGQEDGDVEYLSSGPQETIVTETENEENSVSNNPTNSDSGVNSNDLDTTLLLNEDNCTDTKDADDQLTFALDKSQTSDDQSEILSINSQPFEITAKTINSEDCNKENPDAFDPDSSLDAEIKNLSISSSEEKSDLRSREREDQYTVPDILSLLRVWSDDSPRRLKTLEHASIIMKNLLCEHLPGFSTKESIPDSPECLLILLQDCLSQYRGTINALKSKSKDLELELEETRRTATERYHLLVEEHKERLSRVFQDHEQQLTAAVERAINSRRQAGSLQAQLGLAQTRVEQLETQGKEYAEVTLMEYKKKLNELLEEKESLVAKFGRLEEVLKLKESELEAMDELNKSLQAKNETITAHDKEYIKKLEKDLASESALVGTLRDELQQEQQHNKDLWIETDRKAQEVAVLQSKLETSNHEIIHKDSLLKTLREEILNKFNTLYQETLDQSSMLSDSGMSVSWISSVQQQISSASTEIQEKSSTLALKELTLNDIQKELKDKETRIENIRDERDKSQTKIRQLTEDLNVKKEQITKAAIHCKKAEKKIGLLLEQLNEKNNILQSLKQQVKEIEHQTEEITRNLQEGKKRMKDVESNVSASDEYHKQLLDKLKTMKREEESLKNQCLSKQCHVDHLYKLLESKIKLINNLEQQLKENSSKLTHIISAETDNKFDVSYIQNRRKHDSTTTGEDHRSVIVDKQNLTKEYSINDNLLAYNTTAEFATNKHIKSHSKPPNNFQKVKIEQTQHAIESRSPGSVKCKKKLEKLYSPLKTPSVDSGHVSGSAIGSPQITYPEKKSRKHDDFISRESYLNGTSNESKDESITTSNSLPLSKEQSAKETNCVYSHTIYPNKANSPLTVNINLQSPQTPYHHRKSIKPERLYCNVAIDMKTISTSSKSHKPTSSSFAENVDTSVSDKEETKMVDTFSITRTPDRKINFIPKSNIFSKQPFSPRSSTPIQNQSSLNQSNNSFSTYLINQDSSEHEERLPIEGNEQT